MGTTLTLEHDCHSPPVQEIRVPRDEFGIVRYSTDLPTAPAILSP
jgi:hypothetical protein